MKSTLDLRPVHCRREDRIRTHILLCWLALLLIRIIEHETNDTWRNIRNELQRLHLGTFTSPAGTCQQRTELTTRQRELLRTLALPEPARFTCLDPPARLGHLNRRPLPETRRHAIRAPAEIHASTPQNTTF